jgi:anti-sigma factor RsiW
MSECANVEMRELLPELVNDRLERHARARVEAHLAACEECAAELEALRVVRRIYARTPAIDTATIVAALPRPGARPAAPVIAIDSARAARPARRFVPARLAAAITVIALGGTSLVVARRAFEGRAPTIDSTGAQAQAESTVVTAANTATGAKPADTGRGSATRAPAGTPRPADGPELAFAGGIGDLDTAELESLLASLDAIEATPDEEPEHIAPAPAAPADVPLPGRRGSSEDRR